MDYTKQMPRPGCFLPVAGDELTAPLPKSEPLFGSDPDQAGLLAACARYNEIQQERVEEILAMESIADQLAAMSTLSEDCQARALEEARRDAEGD